ncbi:MAG TPA: HD domain-containing phosphohydrolase [Gaiella sp.]
MGDSRTTDALRSETLDAARGMVQGEQALAAALQAVREESERATEAYRAVVRSLTTALAARDGYTGAHSDVVHDLSMAVARELGLDGQELADVAAVALLHDIGKIGVPDHVLHKHGPLDDSEWALMREHPVIGDQILRHLPGLASVAVAVRHEHERWDGKGYPDGLRGEAIPLASRIVLACDAFSALVSDRPYRRALTVDEARAELERCAGTQFDPAVVSALLRSLGPDGAVARDPGAISSGGSMPEAAEARRLEREVGALITVASAVAAVETLDDLVEVAAEEARAAIDAASLSISRWEAERRVLRTIVNVGDLADWEERRPVDEVYRLEDYDVLQRLLDGVSYVTSVDSDDGLVREHEVLRSAGKHCAVVVPILLGGQPWGEIWGARRIDQPLFGDRDVHFLQTIAGQIAAAVGRTELFARMADLAFRDPLTGVGNRRALEERLELAVSEALAAGKDLAVLLCDLDNLKELNDVMGHHAGDEALRRVAAALVAEAGGEAPLVYRIGGDELCLVLDDVGPNEAVALGERVLHRLAGDPEALTVSCGVASLTMGVVRAVDLLRAADAAQYTAKRSGRGRICLADPHPTVEWRRQAPAAGSRRRRFRDRAPTDVLELMEETLAALDGPLGRADVHLRLEDLVSRLVAGLDAARGAVCVAPVGSGTLDAVFTLDARRGRVWRSGLGVQHETWRIDDYPSTARILAGGSFVVRAADADADPAERAILEEFGMTAVLAAAAEDGGNAWLVELFADGDPSPLEAAEAVTRLLVREAVASPTAREALRAHAVA